MTHKHFSSGFGNQEHRLIFNTNIPGGTPQNSGELNQLFMRNDRETVKNLHAYDNVQQRIREYTNEIGTLSQRLETTDVSATIAALQNTAHNPYFVQRCLTYPQPVIDRLSQGESLDRIRAEMGVAATQAITHFYYNVERLEVRYAEAEDIIARLEVRLINRRQIVSPRFSDRQLAARTNAFRAQREATQPSQLLQTIQIDEYNRPFTNIAERSYHLLRVPSNVTMLTGEPALIEGTDYTEVRLSGGAKYYKILRSGIRKFEEMIMSGERPRVRFLSPVLGPVRDDNVDVAIVTLSTDGLRNLVFTFAPTHVPSSENPRSIPLQKPLPSEPSAGPRPAPTRIMPPAEEDSAPPTSPRDFPPRNIPSTPNPEVPRRPERPVPPAPAPNPEPPAQNRNSGRTTPQIDTTPRSNPPAPAPRFEIPPVDYNRPDPILDRPSPPPAPAPTPPPAPAPEGPSAARPEREVGGEGPNPQARPGRQVSETTRNLYGGLLSRLGTIEMQNALIDLRDLTRPPHALAGFLTLVNEESSQRSPEERTQLVIAMNDALQQQYNRIGVPEGMIRIRFESQESNTRIGLTLVPPATPAPAPAPAPAQERSEAFRTIFQNLNARLSHRDMRDALRAMTSFEGVPHGLTEFEALVRRQLQGLQLAERSPLVVQLNHSLRQQYDLIDNGSEAPVPEGMLRIRFFRGLGREFELRRQGM